MSLPAVEKLLYRALQVLVFVSLLLYLVYLPSNCRFFPDPHPGSDPITPENPHANPHATPFYKISHVMTLTAYFWLSFFILTTAFYLWQKQMELHHFIEYRIAVEKNVKCPSLRSCLISLFRLPNDDGVISSQGVECPFGACCCWSTSCFVWMTNWIIFILSFWFTLWGWGVYESTNRSDQNPSCRTGVPLALYLFVLNALTFIMYFITILVRCCCTVSAKVSAFRTRRRGRGNKKAGNYEQVGSNEDVMDVQLQLDDDLDDIMEEEDDQDEMQHNSQIRIEMSNTATKSKHSNSKNINEFVSSNPHLTSNTSVTATPLSSENQASSSSVYMQQDREMMELLGSGVVSAEQLMHKERRGTSLLPPPTNGSASTSTASIKAKDTDSKASRGKKKPTAHMDDDDNVDDVEGEYDYSDIHLHDDDSI